MKKAFCTLMLIMPGIAFFMEDFGSETIGLRIFGICLWLVVIFDFGFKKNLIVPVFKICYFVIYIPYVLYRMRKERKRKQRAENFRHFWNGFRWYW